MTTNGNSPYDIRVNVESAYLDEESSPEDHRYVFTYTITISNWGTVPAKLLTRRWNIIDSEGKVQQVYGEGVVGEQPHISPGEGFQYTSWTMIGTPPGNMQGSYQMIADDGFEFDAEIPPFQLAMPHTLH